MANVEEEVAEAVEAVEAKTEKKGKPKAKPKKENKLAARILKVMATLKANGIVETNSTVLKEKVGTKTRGAVRVAMKALAKDGKVVIIEEPHGTRKQFKYKLA